MKAGGLKSKNVLFRFQSSSGGHGALLMKWCANFYVPTSVAKIILPQNPLKWWVVFFCFFSVWLCFLGINSHHSYNNFTWIHLFPVYQQLSGTELQNFTVLRFCFFPFSFYLFENCAQAIKNKETWTGYLGVKVFNFLCPRLSDLSRLFLHLFCVWYVFIFYLRMYISLYSSFTSCKYSHFSITYLKN